MVQSIDNTNGNSVYNAVKISIKNPQVNASSSKNGISANNGTYNAVSIDIDNPSVNTNRHKKIYDYPAADEMICYDMAQIKPVILPPRFNLAYASTNVIIPEVECKRTGIEGCGTEVQEENEAENVISDEPAVISEEEIEVPEPNYTTTETEKGIAVTEEYEEEPDVEPENIEENPAPVVVKKEPEIIPGEEILPEVDIPLIVSNLTNPDFDIQAQQMEEIARISLDNPENAVPYIVREVFAALIDITKADSTALAAPTDEQVDARKKLISNLLAIENTGDSQPELPYKLTERDMLLAGTLSPMELAERNKEYALYTISILSKIYTDEVEKQTGNVVPLTDLPGSAAIVDALRYSPNAGVKTAAVDALRHIQRPEYKEELTALYTLAMADVNPQVSEAASRALDKLQ